MQINTSGYSIKRFPDDSMDFSDIITSGAVRSGPVSYTEGPQGDEMLNIPFTPEPTAAEQWLITIRVLTKDGAQETLYRNVQDAIGASRAWRDPNGPGGQLWTQANNLAGNATLTQANLRAAFSGIADTLARLGVEMEQKEWLAEQLLLLMNKQR